MDSLVTITVEVDADLLDRARREGESDEDTIREALAQAAQLRGYRPSPTDDA